MTRNHNNGKDLPPLEPLIPIGKTIYLDPEAGMQAFQSAIREMDDFPDTVPMEMVK